MMLQYRMLRFAPKNMLITTVGRRGFPVEFFLIERQRFISDVIVGIRSTAVTALSKYIEHMSVAEADAVFIRHDVFIRLVPPLNGTTADHIITGLTDWVPLLVTKHLQHLESRRQRFCERLADGGLGECGNATRHKPDIVIYHGAGNE